jgi:hypothetical protein
VIDEGEFGRACLLHGRCPAGARAATPAPSRSRRRRKAPRRRATRPAAARCRPRCNRPRSRSRPRARARAPPRSRASCGGLEVAFHIGIAELSGPQGLQPLALRAHRSRNHTRRPRLVGVKASPSPGNGSWLRGFRSLGPAQETAYQSTRVSECPQPGFLPGRRLATTTLSQNHPGSAASCR